MCLTHALKILQQICTKIANFFKQSKFRKRSIDLDVIKIGVGTLQKTVNSILQSPNLIMLLRRFFLEIAQVSEPKQTETTQRWKIQLAGKAGLIIPTKIEFSRRGLGDSIEFESIDSSILSNYRLHPIFVPHYGPA